MAAFHFVLLLLVLSGACGAYRRRSENDTTRKLRQFESKLQKLETEVQAYPTTNSTTDRLERLEVLVNLLLEDVYNVRADQELLKRDIIVRLKEIEDKISTIQPPAGPSGWMQFVFADQYKDFRPVKNYTDDDLPKVHRDCRDAYDSGWTSSGIYRIVPEKTEFDVYCDNDGSNGGWVVIQRRLDGSVNFGRDWSDYRDGFGDLKGEHWIGNQKLYELTSRQDTKLRVVLEYIGDGYSEVVYDHFSIGDERVNFGLKVSGYQGSETAGDSLSDHDGQYFSTVNAENTPGCDSCAAMHGGGWWHKRSPKSNLNGVYTSRTQNGMFWKSWAGYSNTLRSVTMMVKGADSQVNGSYVDGDLRLVHPNKSRTEGRLEIMFNDTWGSVCDDNFDGVDAMVACRQLGFDNGTSESTRFPGTGPIWLDEVRCRPSDTHLLDCPHQGVGNHNCGHHEDAYVSCHDTPEVNGSYVDGDLRLINPNGRHTEGRLEILLNDTWGSICDDNFDGIDAMVACRQLGFDNGTSDPTRFPGTGPIWLDELRCRPNDTRLLDCPHQGVGNHDCRHQEDVYVSCHDTPEFNSSYVDGDLRLVHPSGNNMEGRLEIILNNTWGTICDDYFDDIDATVACTQLGFGNGTYESTIKLPGMGPIWLGMLHCRPYHTRLLDCPHSGIGNFYCRHGEDVYISCHGDE